MAELSVYEEQIKKRQKKGIPRLLEIAGTKSFFLILSGLLSILAATTQLTPFITIYLMVKELIIHLDDLQSINIAYIWLLGWITAAGIAAYAVFGYISNMLSHIAAFNILYEIRVALVSKLARMPMGYFNQKTSGGLKKIINEDVERIELFVAHHIPDLVQAIALPIISYIFLFFFDWRIAIAALLPIPLAALAHISMYGKAGEKMYHEWQKKLEAMNSTIVEYVRGMPVIKIFNQTVSAFKRFSNDVYAYRDLTLNWIKLSSIPYVTFTVLLNSSALFILPIGFFLLRSIPNGEQGILITTLFLFLYVSMGIAVPIFKLSTLSAYLIQIKTGLVGIDAILNGEEINETQSGQKPQDTTVEFKNVTFAYENHNVLKNISFKAAPGTVTALVGPSGGGKTTIANLIGRLWDVQSGQVCIGGIPVTDMSVDRLNHTVSTLFQDVFLFYDTIEENIRMGNSEASQNDLIAAARAARIHDFIETLPRGYQTMIGQGGATLSGGEKQRISIARAILKDAPIVLLDEATASLDPENELFIQQAIGELIQNRTLIVIAHRLSTITHANQILVLKDGHIIEQGTHQAILANENGFYHAMWMEQARAHHWKLGTRKKISV